MQACQTKELTCPRASSGAREKVFSSGRQSQVVPFLLLHALFCPQHFNSAFVRIRKLAQYPTVGLDVCCAIISREVFTFSFLESNTCAEYGVPQVSSFWSKNWSKDIYA